MCTLLLDLRPEAGFTFDTFGSTSLLQKVYVCVCERFLSYFVLFSVQLESTWASKDDQAGFVTPCHGLKLLSNMYAVLKSMFFKCFFGFVYIAVVFHVCCFRCSCCLFILLSTLFLTSLRCFVVADSLFFFLVFVMVWVPIASLSASPIVFSSSL